MSLRGAALLVLASAACACADETTDARDASFDTRSSGDAPDAATNADPDGGHPPDTPRYWRVDETGWCVNLASCGCVDVGWEACGANEPICSDQMRDWENCGSCSNRCVRGEDCIDAECRLVPIVDFWGDGEILRSRVGWTSFWESRVLAEVVDADRQFGVGWFVTSSGSVLHTGPGREAVDVPLGEAARSIALGSGTSLVLVVSEDDHLFELRGDVFERLDVEGVIEAEAPGLGAFIARTRSGAVMASGDSYELTGLGGVTTGDAFLPLALPLAATDIDCRAGACCAALTDESVWCWGRLWELPTELHLVPQRIEGVVAPNGIAILDQASCARDAEVPGGYDCWRGPERYPLARLTGASPTLVRESDQFICAWIEESSVHGRIECVGPEPWSSFVAFGY